jgi:hypothetical protein
MSLKWRKFSDELPDKSRDFLCKTNYEEYLIPSGKDVQKVGEDWSARHQDNGCGCCSYSEKVTEWAYIEEEES